MADLGLRGGEDFHDNVLFVTGLIDRTVSETGMMASSPLG